MLDLHRAFIVKRLSQTPHLTLHALKDELAARGLKVSHNTVWLFLRREGLRFKKEVGGDYYGLPWPGMEASNLAIGCTFWIWANCHSMASIWLSNSFSWFTRATSAMRAVVGRLSPSSSSISH